MVSRKTQFHVGRKIIAKYLRQLRKTTFTKSEKRVKTATYKKVDSATYKWLKNAIHSNIPINSNIFKMKVLDFAESLGLDDFKASHGMLRRWKKRFNVSLKTVSGKYTFTTSLEVVASRCL